MEEIKLTICNNWSGDCPIIYPSIDAIRQDLNHGDNSLCTFSFDRSGKYVYRLENCIVFNDNPKKGACVYIPVECLDNHSKCIGYYVVFRRADKQGWITYASRLFKIDK